MISYLTISNINGSSKLGTGRNYDHHYSDRRYSDRKIEVGEPGEVEVGYRKSGLWLDDVGWGGVCCDVMW